MRIRNEDVLVNMAPIKKVQKKNKKEQQQQQEEPCDNKNSFSERKLPANRQ